MDLRLKVSVGKNAGQELRIPPPKFLIGRGEDCQLRPKSDLISRHHCVLLVDEETVAIRDLGSRNGTFVNDERLFGEVELKTGDRIKFGPLEFDVVVAPLAPAKKLPAVTSIKEAAERVGDRASDDLDIASWVGTEEPGAAAIDTRELRSADTEEIQVERSASDTTVSDKDGIVAPEAGQTQTAQSPHAPHAKGKPGKLPLGPKKADSREAAADVLRKFFHRR